MEIGIRELKAKLSEYVHRAAEGEAVVVTDRGTPVAVLSAVGGAALVRRGQEQGWITAATSRGLTPFVPVPASRHTSAVLDEDRDE